MKQLAAFTGKEFMESVRTGKLLILSILFILFGIMNPAIAKLTPWMMEIMSESFAENGMSITVINVDAMTSWMQFYKNIPMALIIFLLMFSSILTSEYQKGTLINIITKGMKRWKIIISKAVLMLVLWTSGFWACYIITYGYNEYFWDNRIASHVFLSAACIYLMGIWLISLIIFFSTVFKSNSPVIISCTLVFALSWLLGLLPDIKKYLPTFLFNSQSMLNGGNEPSDYLYAVIAALILFVINIVISIINFNKNTLHSV